MSKSVSEMTAVEQWAVFLAKANDPECRDAINEILKRKEGISVAYEMLTSISADENERARFRSRRIWQMDRDHEIAVAHEQARLEFEKTRLEFEKARLELEQALADKEKALADAQALIAKLSAKLDDRAQ